MFTVLAKITEALSKESNVGSLKMAFVVFVGGKCIRCERRVVVGLLIRAIVIP
jgi:hypothetical protein